MARSRVGEMKGQRGPRGPVESEGKGRAGQQSAVAQSCGNFMMMVLLLYEGGGKEHYHSVMLRNESVALRGGKGNENETSGPLGGTKLPTA